MEDAALNEIFEQGLKRYDEAMVCIRQCLSAYESICEKHISAIAEVSSLKEAENYFDILYSIQNKLSMLLFARNIEIGGRLVNLTKEFDRLYDPYIREYWFRRFKEGVRWPD